MTNSDLDDAHKHTRKNGHAQLSRKEARKQERQGKRQRKAEFYNSSSNNLNKPGAKRNASHEHPDSPQHKKRKFSQSGEGPSAPKSQFSKTSSLKASTNRTTPFEDPSHAKDNSSSSKSRKSTRGTTNKVVSQPRVEKKRKESTSAVLPRTRQEEEEDAYIVYLESKLGYKKGGRKSSKLADDDGLDGMCHILEITVSGY